MTHHSKGPNVSAGIDVGDKYSHLCLITQDNGEIIEETRLRTTKPALKRYFDQANTMRIAIETGPHSPWMSRLLTDCGHDVLVANPHKFRLIHQSSNKTDERDAEKLARVARFDPKLLSPITHRGEQAQTDLAAVRAREALVKCRTELIMHVRSVLKAFGLKAPRCNTESFHHKVQTALPNELRAALDPLIESIESMTLKIRGFDKHIDKLADENYPQTTLLRQVRGVGALTGLTFILTLEDPTRFKRSREVGAYLGMVPARKQSGERDLRQRISKEGDRRLRCLLVQSAHYLLGPFGEECDLRRFGMKIIERGGRHARKRAVVAVARKLSVLLHHLWVTGEVYDPDYQQRRSGVALTA